MPFHRRISEAAPESCEPTAQALRAEVAVTPERKKPAAKRTGHRWRVVGQLAAERGMPFVCVQPLMSSWARRAEDLTFDKTDDKDAVLITPWPRSCAATCPSRSMRGGAGCATWAFAVPGWSPGR